MMDNIISRQREARLRYLDADIQILQQGEFVRCGVTGDPIRLDGLKYWNVEKQIAYKSAEVAFADMYRV
jgi:hypothetical protein